MQNEPVYKFGGTAAQRFEHACGLIFCRQAFNLNGTVVDVVAIWREPDQAQITQNCPVYVMVCNMISRGTEAVLGCAVLCLEHLGINRPRLGTIQRVAGMLTEMSVAGGHKSPPSFNL